MKGTKGKQPRTEVTVQDQRSARTAGAIASAWTSKGESFAFREVDATVEAYVDLSAGGITKRASTGVTFRIHSGTSTGDPGNTPIRHSTINLQDAELGDLPLIALALLGALREGVSTGSFPTLEGVGEAE